MYGYSSIIPIGTKVIYNRGRYKKLTGLVIDFHTKGRHFNTNVLFSDNTVMRVTSGCLKPA